MARQKAIIGTRVVRGKKRHTPSASRRTSAQKRTRLKRSHAHVLARPRISRARLRFLRDDLDGARNTMSDTFEKFWIIPEHDIRETLARTHRRIKRAVDMLSRAA